MPEGLDAAGIDAFVTAAMRAGEDLYHLDEGALSGLDADLVVTQDLCAVCAVDVSVVDDALAHLGCTAEVLTIDPHTLDEVLASVAHPGHGHRHRGRGDGAGGLAARPARRVRAEVAGRRRTGPRVLLLEWTDPPFAPGSLGARDGHGRGRRTHVGAAGEKSVRVTWEQALAGEPEVVVCAPCGYDLEGAATSRRPSSTRACCRRTSRCGRWTRTRRSRVPDLASWTAWRASRTSSTRRWTAGRRGGATAARVNGGAPWEAAPPLASVEWSWRDPRSGHSMARTPPA